MYRPHPVQREYIYSVQAEPADYFCCCCCVHIYITVHIHSRDAGSPHSSLLSLSVLLCATLLSRLSCFPLTDALSGVVSTTSHKSESEWDDTTHAGRVCLRLPQKSLCKRVNVHLCDPRSHIVIKRLILRFYKIIKKLLYSSQCRFPTPCTTLLHRLLNLAGC